MASTSDEKFTISTLPGFNPPGNLPDFNSDTRKLWSNNYISYWMTGEIKADPNVVSPGRTPLQQFFNGTILPFDNSQQTAATWNAFPKLVTSAYKTTPLRWQVADASRMFQDEYLEWSVSRNRSTNDINSVTFTCEGPEYWQVYASYQRDDFISTIRNINSDFQSEMQDSDFFLVDPKTGASVYNPNNYWNLLTTTGTITHLVQPNNTLSAEIDIAAQATVIRKNAQGIITDPNVLILCSQYGNPGRHSDPTIGGVINQAARSKLSLSVADPVALYIHDFDTSNFKLDTAKTTGIAVDSDLIDIPNPDQVFLFQRQGILANGKPAPNQGLRLRVKIPDGLKGKNGQQLNVSNIYDTKTKQHIRYGAQFADYVTMSVSAVSVNAPLAPALPCMGAAAAVEPVANVALSSLDEVPLAVKTSSVPVSVNRKSHSWVADLDM